MVVVIDTVDVRPRFSIVIAVKDRADIIGRAVAAVLAQTFARLEVVVVDRGSSDDSLAAVRAVADHRVRVLDGAVEGLGSARTAGIEAARGRWVAVLDPDDEVAPGWLAKLGRIIDGTDAELVSCGGQQRHLDGSLTEVIPAPLAEPVGHEGPGGFGDEEHADLLFADSQGRYMPVKACFRPGSFVTTRRLMLEVGAFGGPQDERDPGTVGRRLVQLALESRRGIAHTPDLLVRWNEHPTTDVQGERSDALSGDLLRLTCSLQGIDAFARTPIPDGRLLIRYAVAGGVAAVRLGELREARRLFRLARRLEPGVPRHWVRSAAALLPPVAGRVWAGEDETAATTVLAGATAN